MAKIDIGKDVMCLQIWGKMGYPNGLGLMILGWSRLGEYLPLAGYYQRRHTGKMKWNQFMAVLGLMKLGWNRLGDDRVRYELKRKSSQFCIRTKHYWPKNPQTETQQTWRAIFSAGVTAWHALTASEKLYYNRLKFPERQSGFTRFMSKYLSENYPPA